MTRTLSLNRLLAGAVLLLFASLVIAFAPRVAFGKTATEVYAQCMSDAAVAANNCYMTVDGFFEKATCDVNYTINKAACVNALFKAVLF